MRKQLNQKEISVRKKGSDGGEYTDLLESVLNSTGGRVKLGRRTELKTKMTVVAVSMTNLKGDEV